MAKYRGADSAHLFSKRIGSVSFDSATAVAVDMSNNIYVLGTYYGTVDFGGPLPLMATSTELFLAKYSLAGAYSWARAFGPDLFGQSLVVNSAGDLALSGMFCGTVSLGGSPRWRAGHLTTIDTFVIVPATRGMRSGTTAPGALIVVSPLPISTSGKNTSCPVSPGAHVVPLLVCAGPCTAPIDTWLGVPCTWTKTCAFAGSTAWRPMTNARPDQNPPAKITFLLATAMPGIVYVPGVELQADGCAGGVMSSNVMG